MSVAEENTRSTGVVLRFNDSKGYGFIKPDDGGEDLFVHQSEIKSDGYRTLQNGQAVEFSVILDGGKTKAIEVTGPNGSPLENKRDGGYGGGRGGRGGGGGYGFGSGGGFRSGGRNGGGGGGGECYNCGEYGHMARDCESQGNNSGGGGGGGSGGACFNCGGFGHMARDCSGSRGGGGGGGGGCYSCGEQGHLARDCPQGGGGGGGRGGSDRFGGGGRGGSDRFGGGGGGGGGGCYNCGQPGHFARECPNNS